MIPFSDRTAWELRQNPLSTKTNELLKAGVRILDLTITNPTRCGLQYPEEIVLRAFHSPCNLDYAPDPHGLLSARKAVQAYYAKKNIELSPEQIFLTASTSEAYSFVFKLLGNAGDTFLAPEPSYPILDYLGTLCDIHLSRYALKYQNGWKIDWNQLEHQLTSEAPRGFIFVNPNNPTGNYLTEQDHLQLNSALKNYPLPVIADEVFLDFPLKEFPASFSSFASRNETLTFTLSGVSKILGLPQMKLSWIVVTGPDTLRKQAIEKLEIISDTYLSVSTPIQNALPLLLSEGLTIQTEILKRIRSNYLYLQQTLNGKPHLSLLENQGGWVAVLKCSDQRTDEEWSVELLEKDFILTHPGFFYDFMEGSHLVISLLTPTEILREACPRILRRTGNI